MIYFKLTKNLFNFLLIIFSLLIFVIATKAQITPIEKDVRFNEWSFEKLKRQKPLNPTEEKLQYNQLNKDFIQLQILNNDLIKTRTSGENMDYNLIAQIKSGN